MRSESRKAAKALACAGMQPPKRCQSAWYSPIPKCWLPDSANGPRRIAGKKRQSPRPPRYLLANVGKDSHETSALQPALPLSESREPLRLEPRSGMQSELSSTFHPKLRSEL